VETGAGQVVIVPFSSIRTRSMKVPPISTPRYMRAPRRRPPPEDRKHRSGCSVRSLPVPDDADPVVHEKLLAMEVRPEIAERAHGEINVAGGHRLLDVSDLHFDGLDVDLRRARRSAVRRGRKWICPTSLVRIR
jgi:hypothetical protein